MRSLPNIKVRKRLKSKLARIRETKIGLFKLSMLPNPNIEIVDFKEAFTLKLLSEPDIFEALH